MNFSKSVSYQEYLLESLKDPDEAAGYLSAALEGGNLSVFLLALKNVIEARGGVSQIALLANKGRNSLYKTLSEKGNPYLSTMNKILEALDLHLVVESTLKKYKTKKSILLPIENNLTTKKQAIN